MQSFQLDRLDRRILAILSAGGRETITDISRRVGLSPTPLAARVARMESTGIIEGYRADIDVERLAGYGSYWVRLDLLSRAPALAREIEAIIVACPFIVECNALQGSPSYVFWVYARSVQHYLDIMGPFRAHEVDYTTFAVSRRVARLRPHKLVLALAGSSESQ